MWDIGVLGSTVGHMAGVNACPAGGDPPPPDSLKGSRNKTQDKIAEWQAKERAFADTPIGKAFHRFKMAHSRYWKVDLSETISDRRLRELHAASDEAERELRACIDRAIRAQQSRRKARGSHGRPTDACGCSPP